MALIEINTNPSRRDLAWFGLIALAFFVFVGATLGRWTGQPLVARTIWTIGVLVAVVYYAVPAVRRPLFVGWMYAAFPIGWVVSHVLLGVMYYGILTPVGLLMRALGRDPMERRFDRAAPSYWVERERVTDVERYFRQF